MPEPVESVKSVFNPNWQSHGFSFHYAQRNHALPCAHFFAARILLYGRNAPPFAGCCAFLRLVYMSRGGSSNNSSSSDNSGHLSFRFVSQHPSSFFRKVAKRKNGLAPPRWKREREAPSPLFELFCVWGSCIHCYHAQSEWARTGDCLMQVKRERKRDSKNKKVRAGVRSLRRRRRRRRTCLSIMEKGLLLLLTLLLPHERAFHRPPPPHVSKYMRRRTYVTYKHCSTVQ